jgi:hypothetical protein
MGRNRKTKTKLILCIISLLIAACTNDKSVQKELQNEVEEVVDQFSVEEVKDTTATPVEDTLDTSFPLFSVNSLGFDAYYTEFIPLSEGLSYDEEQTPPIVPSFLLGDSVSTTLDTIYTLKGKYRKAALKFAGFTENDSVFAYNLNQNKLLGCRVDELPIIAFVNPYGANTPVSTADFVFGLELLTMDNRKEKKLRGDRTRQYSSI